MQQDKIQKVIEYLEKLAQMEACIDKEDFIPKDYCGSNFDDAWYGGMQDGEIKLAKYILEKLK